MAEYGGYDKNGEYAGPKGAYNSIGRKVGFDEDDMANGISDTNKAEFQDPRYLEREDAHIKMHPAVNPKAGKFHPGGSNPGASQLLNTHGGVRNENAIRTDIRHGWNILQQRHPKGVEGGLPHWHAEEVGYRARKHLYIAAEQEAKKKAAPPDRSAERSEQFKVGAPPSAPARIASKPKPSSKPKPYRDPDDTFGAAVKHVINKVRGK
jgi:hypothetical protein